MKTQHRVSESLLRIDESEVQADLSEELVMGAESEDESAESFAFVEQFVVPVAAAIWTQIRGVFSQQAGS